ncbi:putative YigZ family protein [Natronoflexus pectinivorans]|uniref:Putative YigZ family protein n=2 Tax=Natronoflexus pectinivorans TaxID=682526 RepID=A0A4R2GK29_9BACT|nr:putative YigZ family protein [Natronoflexus pectinivorans]
MFMELSDTYKTLAQPAEGLYKEKGSKFLAFAWPVKSEVEIKDLIDQVKAKYYDARHHCYAWQLGNDGMHFRVNDDGEPSGTAGKPIHGQIKSNEITNVLILVVRYFGGTKLGTSGLIQAYKEAAADAISNGIIVERTVDKHLTIQFAYENMNDVMRVIKEIEPSIVHQDFNLRCEMVLSIRESKYQELLSRFEQLMDVSLIDEKP